MNRIHQLARLSDPPDPLYFHFILKRSLDPSDQPNPFYSPQEDVLSDPSDLLDQLYSRRQPGIGSVRSSGSIYTPKAAGLLDPWDSPDDPGGCSVNIGSYGSGDVVIGRI